MTSEQAGGVPDSNLRPSPDQIEAGRREISALSEFQPTEPGIGEGTPPKDNDPRKKYIDAMDMWASNVLDELSGFKENEDTRLSLGELANKKQISEEGTVSIIVFSLTGSRPVPGEKKLGELFQKLGKIITSEALDQIRITSAQTIAGWINEKRLPPVIKELLDNPSSAPEYFLDDGQKYLDPWRNWLKESKVPGAEITIPDEDWQEFLESLKQGYTAPLPGPVRVAASVAEPAVTASPSDAEPDQPVLPGWEKTVEPAAHQAAEPEEAKRQEFIEEWQKKWTDLFSDFVKFREGKGQVSLEEWAEDYEKRTGNHIGLGSIANILFNKRVNGDEFDSRITPYLNLDDHISIRNELRNILNLRPSLLKDPVDAAWGYGLWSYLETPIREDRNYREALRKEDDARFIVRSFISRADILVIDRDANNRLKKGESNMKQILETYSAGEIKYLKNPNIAVALLTDDGKVRRLKELKGVDVVHLILGIDNFVNDTLPQSLYDLGVDENNYDLVAVLAHLSPDEQKSVLKGLAVRNGLIV